MKPTREERFWAKVNKTDTCWLWTACIGRRYGLFSDGTRLVPAHRFSWAQANGPVPEGLLVCHSCDVPLCVRPAHLFLGTHAANMADRNTKGRQASGARHVSRTHPEVLMRGDWHYARTNPERLARGESHGMTPLTEAQVRDIRQRYVPRGGAALAREFGVDKTTISNIVRRKTWAHIS